MGHGRRFEKKFTIFAPNFSNDGICAGNDGGNSAVGMFDGGIEFLRMYDAGKAGDGGSSGAVCMFDVE